jgi:hypothetical protein
MVTVLNGGGWTVVIASRLAPTMGLGAFSWKLVGCQAAFASKPAPTVGLSAFSKLVGSQAGSPKALKPNARSSPLKWPSVSSPKALDLAVPAPSAG